MFKKIFIKLCNKNNVAPTVVCQEIGLSNAAFSKWDDNSIPRKTTLQKIADYFGVSVEYLLGTEEADVQLEPIKEKSNPEIEGLDEYEKKLLNAFRQTTIDGKLRILNAVDEITKEIEKNSFGANSTFA